MESPETKLTKYEKLSNGIKCPKCFESDFWKTRDNRLKCRNCRHLFIPRLNPFNLSNRILNEIIIEFLLGHSTNIILERVNVSKYKLLKILTVLRILMTKDLPEVFANIVKSKETYFPKTMNPTGKEFALYLSRPQKEIKISNKEDKENLEYFKKEKANLKSKLLKQSVIGILCLEGKFFAKILPNIGARDLKFLLKKGDKKREMIVPDSWGKYFGLIFKSRIYRLAPLNTKKSRINVLEGFWGHLKRKLAAKGGIRKEKLPLYLGEYVWKYNHRKLPLKEQQKILLNLSVRKYSRN